ncbi:glycogen synthase [Mucilaginibacter aquatilis]|uniref:Glycogen synthase n=1 Tax=Mucilaginibacter aquatilis TaxID=1517760 RepID=A0A6I4I6H8_9SPHI|nr:glycogen/starch synthase [Mucilaginibacter aquatilis]MVN90682.1 glycosyltransferase [Mucilaginibacter aquatilis]
MKVYHLAAECYPVAKVGGLADVVGALPKYQTEAGLQAAVVLPFYNRKFVQENEFDVVFEASTLLGKKRYEFEIWKERADTLGFELYLIYVPGLLDRQEVYMYPDEREQFIIFQLAFLDWINWSQQRPDVIHCHDHHVGLIPFLMKHSALYSKKYAKTKTVFTIHNGQYHGAFNYDKFDYLPEVDMNFAGLLDWQGAINPLACAIKCVDKYTAVSPSYLEELTHSSNGLEYLFWLEHAKGKGIINGIDTEVWNPFTDPMIKAKIYAKKPESGKLANKKALCERFGLSADQPLIAFIGRLVGEKGADLLPEAFSRSLQKHAGKVNIIMLGAGDKETETALTKLNEIYPDNYKTYIGYNEELAHQIYAGSDFLLMPSRVEPCGLNQLYSLRYGTLPIVRRTGGLIDTVTDFGDPNGYGICFNNSSVNDICYSIDRAVTLYKNTEQLDLLRKRMMALDFSWTKSAKEYIMLYESLTSII